MIFIKYNISIKFLINNFSKIKCNILIGFKGNFFNEIIFWLYKTALFTAIEKENIEIIKLLLNNGKIDVNLINI